MLADRQTGSGNQPDVIGLELYSNPYTKLHEAGTVVAAVNSLNIEVLQSGRANARHPRDLVHVTRRLFEDGLMELALNLRNDLSQLSELDGEPITETLVTHMPVETAVALHDCLGRYVLQTFTNATPQFRDWNSEGIALSRTIDGVCAYAQLEVLGEVLGDDIVTAPTSSKFGF